MRFSAIAALCLLVACGDDQDKDKNNAPVATIVAPSDDPTINVGETVTFEGSCSDADGDALTHAWDFGGGGAVNSNEVPGPIAFVETGTFEVVYTCSDTHGERGTASVTVTVQEPANAPPVASIDTPGTDVTIGVGLAVVFAATCTDADGGTVTHAWDFDGAAAASTLEDPGSITFDTVGEYDVTYVCTDDRDEASATITRTITVVPPPNEKPVAQIDVPAEDTSEPIGTTIRFHATCTDPDGDPVTHFWAFDGLRADSTDEDPGDVELGAAGTYEVTYTCTDSHDNVSEPVTRVVTVTGALYHLEGRITFDKVRTTAEGLDYEDVTVMPARHIDVYVMDAADDENLIKVAITDDDGHYEVEWGDSLPSNVVVVALARVASPLIVVRDNTNGGALYGTGSDPIDATATTTVDLHMAAGWTGDGYDDARAAAPFAILDAAYTAERAFLDARPSIAFPELVLYWSKNNAPTERGENETDEEARAAGHIGTSHWNGEALYILGTEDVDADEFDDHIIAHEWGHYFQSKLSRSDTPGGTHSAGDIKDPRLALGEGWGNAVSAVVFYPDTVYIDTSGVGQAESFTFDVEVNAEDANPGWYSEVSAQNIILDLFDDSGDDEDFDQVALGLGPIYDAMVGPMKETALTTMFALIDALKQAEPDAAEAIDALTAHNGVFGVPVADAYGTGETKDGGFAGSLPVFNTFEGGAVTVALGGGGLTNELKAMRYIRFEGDGQSYVIQTTTVGEQDVDLEVRKAGEVVLGSYFVGDELTDPLPTEDGVEYVIIVLGLGTLESYTTSVTIEAAE